jgi:antitoxin (DNA-binding transcriptional repressor) of toxin-antitoxin stability system
VSPEEMEVARLIDAVTEGQPKTRAAIGKMIAVVVATAERTARNEALEDAAQHCGEHEEIADRIRAMKR